MSGGRLLILGASGHGKVVGDCARAMGRWSEILFFDQRWPDLTGCGPWRVIGRGEDLVDALLPGDQFFVAIGNSATRLTWLRHLRGCGISLATVIHPYSQISSSVVVGEGGIVVAGAVVNIDACLGIGCIINTAASVDHDCQLGDGVHVCPGAHLAGDVRVGESSWIGIGAAVRQGIRIGAAVMVGAGAVVVADIADGLTVAGVPARPVIKNNELELKC